MPDLAELQDYLRQLARERHDIVPCPPLCTAFFHISDSDAESSYAIPDPPASASPSSDDLQISLSFLQAECTSRNRSPRLQFIEDLFVDLPPLLRSNGWVEQERSPLMIWSSAGARPTPPVPGLSIATLSADSTLEEICEGLDTNTTGFDLPIQPASAEEAEGFRQGLIRSRAFTAHLGIQPAGAGMFTTVSEEGVTELVGITTLAPFRRRGIAASLTAYMTAAARAHGATMVFLTAANEQAGRVYERVGFRFESTKVVYMPEAGPGASAARYQATGRLQGNRSDDVGRDEIGHQGNT
jgi:ribosomal protein S18 acetylase RimI-like enzyme